MALREESLSNPYRHLNLLAKHDRSSHDEQYDVTVHQLIQQVPTVSVTVEGSVVQQIFEAQESLEGIVVLHDDRAVGLIMRNYFYRKIGRPFGRELYLNRPVSLMMEKTPLILQHFMDLTHMGTLAMNRPQENLYDFIIINDQTRYLGVISIRNFTMELARRREKQLRLLHKQKETIKSLLDNAGQGFLLFGEDLIISPEYSKECVSLFGQEIGGLNFVDVLNDYIANDQKQILAVVLQSIFNTQKELERKVYLSLLPEEIKIKNVFLHCEYKLITQAEKKMIMTIMTNVTEKKELEQKMEAEKNNLQLVLKALSNQSEMINSMEGLREFFTRSVYEILASPCPVTEKLSVIFRTVHTFKGDFSQMYLRNTALHLHELEDRLAAMCESFDQISQRDIEHLISTIDYQSFLARDMETITDILGEDFFWQSQSFCVTAEQILDIERRVQEAFSAEQQDQLLPLIKRLRCKNLKQIVASYDEYVQNLAIRLDKILQPLVITGDDIFIEQGAYKDFCKSLNHIFRNIVDHGIEDSHTRLAAGKPESGTVAIEIRSAPNNFLTMRIHDDGHGIDPALIRAKALNKGVISEKEAACLSDQEVIALIFRDRFSTKDNISIISGRGVGLSAVQREVELLGGSIHVESKVGQGTTLIICLPVINGLSSCSAGGYKAASPFPN
ncbi:ATP-binding protein [Heliophilum fasciatum]|uniref:histidine kinase n=1 Tax=Heliophilum fasciatum TaxID=35700 RepID=A0A4R2RWV2_9FIRM|nr:ATP-binding protein [Heliophilum fasciatum]MCW2276669.1 two-component system chemotaxis sensor kinase CheA [Heliophilum fasciatum]TCP68950.1 two-component system chemotaxis sensor kinase CheA [Heliophilum fasciatum]